MPGEDKVLSGSLRPVLTCDASISENISNCDVSVAKISVTSPIACVAVRRKRRKSKWEREGEALFFPLSVPFGRHNRLRRLLLLICKPENYWLVKQRILLFIVFNI